MVIESPPYPAGIPVGEGGKARKACQGDDLIGVDSTK